MTPFPWESLLDLAVRLVNEQADDAAIRTAINRAYYAAFNIGREFVEQTEAVPNDRAHDRVWRWFARHEAGLPLLRIGQLGYRLAALRRQADYDADSTLTLADARRAVSEARRLIDVLAELKQ